MKKVLLALCFLLITTVCGAVDAPPSPKQQATYAVRTLQLWYVPETGLYKSPTGWWNAANAITVLANYSRASGSTLYLQEIANTFSKASAASHTHDFLNDYNDDEGWWALAWIDSYDLTGNSEYLAMAETIFADMSTQWETKTCGGGIWWTKQKGGSYKNAIANELYLAVAASLANRAKTAAQKSQYLDWAHKEWQWFKNSGMINSQSLVNDGLNDKNPSACTNNGRRTWSYNQGVILGGLVELYKADHDRSLLATAEAIATATITRQTTPAGVLVDGSVRGGDAPQFKGVFVRNLAYLYKVAPRPEYKDFIRANAKSIWENDQGPDHQPDHQFGALWQGPFDSADATRQTSALDVLIADVEVQKKSRKFLVFFRHRE